MASAGIRCLSLWKECRTTENCPPVKKNEDATGEGAGIEEINGLTLHVFGWTDQGQTGTKSKDS